MKNKKFIFALLLTIVTSNGCAQEGSEPITPTATAELAITETKAPVNQSIHSVSTELMENDALLVRDLENTHASSLFFTKSVSGDEIAESIISILSKHNANKDFLTILTRRLPLNPRIQKPEFSLTLTDTAGIEHKFELKSNTQFNFYTLNYWNSTPKGQ
ncbi:hypothetical protein P886_3054 [Alteromonadaceae bacterium 2753L.S.0a.02]|nr:hypothetical protein P886_3054 [Alteromonadaceae bacterium 2753L.S.0a.02]